LTAFFIGEYVMRDDLVQLIRPSVEALGFEFWGLEFMGSSKHKSLLRVYIEHERGISVDDCETVSRQLSRVLDVEDVIHHEYVLEVSSPGLERPLFYPTQYPHYCGATLALRLEVPIDGQRNFKGVLQQAGTKSIVLQTADKELEINFDQIQKAHLVADWSKAKEQK